MCRFVLLTLILSSAGVTRGQSSPPSIADVLPSPFLSSEPAETLPERYDVLAVDRSQFMKTDVELGQTATFPDYTEELLRVEWREHDPIDVAVVKPHGVSRPPVAIFLYSYGTDPEKFLNRRFCATLAGKGFAAVGFQTALTGPRYHDRPLKQWFVSELPESIGASVHDVQLMIDYLATREDLDSSRLGIFGQGSGGAVAILAAATDRRIKAIDVMNPWGDWPDWLAHSPLIPDDERSDYQSPVFLEKSRQLEPLLWMNHLADRSFRLQQTLFDPSVPDDVRKKMREALPKTAEFAIYPDQVSYMLNVAQNGRMLNWMQDKLGISAVDRSDLSLSTK